MKADNKTNLRLSVDSQKPSDSLGNERQNNRLSLSENKDELEQIVDESLLLRNEVFSPLARISEIPFCRSCSPNSETKKLRPVRCGNSNNI